MARPRYRIISSAAWNDHWVVQRLYCGGVWCDVGDAHPSEQAAWSRWMQLEAGR